MIFGLQIELTEPKDTSPYDLTVGYLVKSIVAHADVKLLGFWIDCLGNVAMDPKLKTISSNFDLQAALQTSPPTENPPP